MPVIDTRDIPVVEKRPGWRGRLFHSPNMTFAHWDFEAGSTIHEHHHDQEEVWHVLEGELEIVIDGETYRAVPGMVAVLHPGARHAVRAITAGNAIVADYPLRSDFA
jgi:quercetin dioxygenase-like cupin family protein